MPDSVAETNFNHLQLKMSIEEKRGTTGQAPKYVTSGPQASRAHQFEKWPTNADLAFGSFQVPPRPTP
jgi:hypothetical protein